MKTFILTLLFGILWIGTQTAQPGSLDDGFGLGGIVSTKFGHLNGTHKGNATAVQQDGKIVAVGVSKGDAIIVRFNPDGTLDNLFGLGGKTVFEAAFTDESSLSCVAIQPDGRIVAAGSVIVSPPPGNNPTTRYLMIRLNTDGTFDESFGYQSGYAWSGENAIVTSLALQEDGKIIVAGSLR